MVSPQGRLRPTGRPDRGIDELLSAFPVIQLGAGPDSARITGIAMGSDDVETGDLFVAVAGAHHHGARFAGAARALGAMAVLTDADGASIVSSDPALADLAVLVTRAPRDRAGEVADWLYGHPSGDLVTVGITGTNGKTTTAYFVDAAMRAAHPLTAVLGTVELRIGDEAIESPRTTVEAAVLHSIAAMALERGSASLVTEVSSHALALGRVRGMEFDVVGFTNLQRDHLDFHHDMETYFKDKSRLFEPGLARSGVVMIDDDWGKQLVQSAEIPVQTVSARGDVASWSVIQADIGLDGVGSSFVLRDPDGSDHEAFSPLPGAVNVSNAALAIAIAVQAGIPIQTAIAAIEAAHAVPGRMERVVERGQGLALGLVDYAHTPDALVLALEAVRPITPGRLVIVLGSDGDRDQGKRPIMGEIAARLADEVFITDENPRSEDPAAIRRAILSGASRVPTGHIHEVTTGRADAIRQAMAVTAEGDTVIVTGKGHEPTQEIAGVFHRYNDRDVFWAILASHKAGSIA